MKYLVIMQNSWGTGDSIKEADNRARKEGCHGRKKMKRLVFSYDPSKTPQVFVSEMGDLCWEGEKPERIEG